MPNSNPSNYSTSTEYELLVKSVYQEILNHEGVETIEVTHNQKLDGKSGIAHQIDVLWRFRRAGIEHLVIIECKNYGKNVELGDVRSFHSVVEDIKGSQGVMVTRVGFQSGATEFAKHHGIGLKLLRAPVEEDWDGLIKSVDIFIASKSFDSRRQASILFGVPREFGDQVVGAHLKGDALDVQLLDKEGVAKTPPMRQWLPKQVPISDKPSGGPYVHKIDLTETYLRFERPDGEEFLVPANAAQITYYVSEYNQTITVDAGQVVKYVLKDFISGDVEHFQR
jgi:hypothetical protein